MAIRPVFVARDDGPRLVDRIDLEFKWHAGFAVSQSRKSIAGLHSAARAAGVGRVLEISTRAETDLGYQLSAFLLRVHAKDGRAFPVECVYQSSKVFVAGGPFRDLLGKTPKEAKSDERLRASGPLRAFLFRGEEWPVVPRTAFYDWLYIYALSQSPELATAVLSFDAFTDIAFTPSRSVNCQAHAAAAFVALHRRGLLQPTLQDHSLLREWLGRECDPLGESRRQSR